MVSNIPNYNQIYYPRPQTSVGQVNIQIHNPTAGASAQSFERPVYDRADMNAVPIYQTPQMFAPNYITTPNFNQAQMLPAQTAAPQIIPQHFVQPLIKPQIYQPYIQPQIIQPQYLAQPIMLSPQMLPAFMPMSMPYMPMMAQMPMPIFMPYCPCCNFWGQGMQQQTQPQQNKGDITQTQNVNVNYPNGQNERVSEVNKANNEMPKPLIDQKQEIKPNNDDMNANQKKEETRKKVILTDDYIKSLENFLNNSNKKVRLIGATELLERFKEDKTRANDPALVALLNKTLNDPSESVRFVGLTILDVGYSVGNDETIQILKQIQQNTKDIYSEDSLLASQVLLKLSTDTKDVPISTGHWQTTTTSEPKKDVKTEQNKAV